MTPLNAERALKAVEDALDLLTELQSSLDHYDEEAVDLHAYYDVIHRLRGWSTRNGA